LPRDEYGQGLKKVVVVVSPVGRHLPAKRFLKELKYFAKSTEEKAGGWSAPEVIDVSFEEGSKGGKVMPILEWQDRFEIGVEKFDTHHKHLFGLLNAFYNGFDADFSDERLSALLDELIDYATYHFHAEEEWMEANKYSGFAGHREHHKYYIKRVVEIQTDFVKEKGHLPLEILTFLYNWLINHILVADVEFGLFVVAEQSPMGAIIQL
jgi:hemerythrin